MEHAPRQGLQGSPGPWRLSGSRGCPLPLSETGKPGAGPGQWSWGEAISRLVFHAIDFMDRIIRGSSALARSQDILDPATSNTAESPAKAMRGAPSRHDEVLAAAVAVRYG